MHNTLFVLFVCGKKDDQMFLIADCAKRVRTLRNFFKRRLLKKVKAIMADDILSYLIQSPNNTLEIYAFKSFSNVWRSTRWPCCRGGRRTFKWSDAPFRLSVHYLLSNHFESSRFWYPLIILNDWVTWDTILWVLAEYHNVNRLYLIPPFDSTLVSRW